MLNRNITTDGFETLNGNTRDIWKLINEIIQGRQGFTQTSTGPSFTVNEFDMNHPKVIVSKVNDYFC